MLADTATLAREGQLPHCLFTQTDPVAGLRVCVIVPVRNESDAIVQTLDALRQQQLPDGQPFPADLYEVLVLTNNCTDDSYNQVRQYQLAHAGFRLHVANVQLSTDRAHIGTVRRLLMDEACRRLLQAGHPQGIIASTDGDTLVDPLWVAQIIAEIDAGNDAVGGRILTLRDAQRDTSPARLPHLRDATYRSLLARAEAQIDPCQHDPWPRHFQHFGASLAVTCQAYVRAGRLPVVRYLEDDAFFKALQRIDARVRKSPRVRVYTSARLQGRVEVGLSWQLQQWANQGQSGGSQLVENPAVSLNRFRLRHDLRDAWQRRFEANSLLRLRPMARLLNLSTGDLLARMVTSTYFGQFWEQIDAQFSQLSVLSPIPVTEAIQILRTGLMEL